MKVLWAPVVLLVAVFAASAQQPAQPASDSPKVTITLGDVTAPPEWQLKVPFSIAIAEGTEVARVSARITYPPKILRFDRVEGSAPLVDAGLELKAEPIKGPADAPTASLQVDVQPKGGAAKPLPDGSLGIIVFRVDEDAEPGETSMSASDVRASGPPPVSAAIPAAAAPPAKITIAPPGLPIFNCFFYMH